jgi:hypothetical protein
MHHIPVPISADAARDLWRAFERAALAARL